ncbi:sensor histidine kinase [Marinobacter vinifirmus]|uniref:histidine kinase n=1 Tax=Marinobacter vinifirmus TaxID=355591 RepID=A0A558B860_9GAMM|nr:sensor histidine kinase [Marinobacter vinifirmus]TVT32699.1 MAG: sensor histidine kinase [Marinobacter vinifirmus]
MSAPDQATLSIKQKLIEMLSDDSTDLGDILTLSTELSKLDANNVRFTVDADHISRLGLELVARKETALSEIVKNAYDADADTVYVNFCQDGGRNWLEVVDNGSGMDRKALIDGFMRISTSLKKKAESSERYGRRRAGKKGIGRFATQRLGLKLTVLTKQREDLNCLRVDIDWGRFESDKELISVSNRIYEDTSDALEKNGFSSGTVLLIDNLRDEWTDSQIRRAYRYTSSLLAPFPVSKSFDASVISKPSGPHNNEKVIDPGFSVVMNRVMDGNEVRIIDTAEMYLKHALAELEGWIDEDGYGHWRVKSNYAEYDSGVKGYVTRTLSQYQDRDRFERDDFYFDKVKNVHFKAYYFNPKGISHLPKLLNSIITENLREYGGIRLYRNGFRVLPYGEKYDDWLRLDFHTKARTILPPVANQNFFGFVDISSDSKGEFEEVASREGLLETDSFNQLRDFVSSSILSAIVDFSYALDSTKVFAGEKGYIKKSRQTFKETIEELNESIEELEKSPSAAPAIGSTDVDLLGDGSEKLLSGDEEAGDSKVVPTGLIENIVRSTRAVIDKAEMYRILAGLGLSMAEFTHEVKFSILKVSDSLAKVASHLEENEQNEDLTSSRIAIDNLRAYTSFFETSFQSLSDKEGQLLDLRKLVNDFIGAIEDTKHEDDQININLDLYGADFFSTKAHRANFDSILVNLYSNSKKAIYKNGGKGNILIELMESSETVEMVFSDDGCGISQDAQDKIFQAFFTTNNQTFDAPDSQQMLGMGLGLTIVKEIVEGLDGDIEVVTPRTGYSTAFKVILPKAEEKDIENEF